MNDEIEFTQADLSHLSNLVALVNSAYRGDSSKAGWTTEADFLDGQRIDAEMLKELIEKPESVVLICQDAETDKILGCVHLEKHNNSCHLGMLTVDPNTQGQGLGSELLKEAEAFAQFWDCDGIKIHVITLRQELIAWYERHGFKATGELVAFPYGQEKYGIPKRPDLQLQVMLKRI